MNCEIEFLPVGDTSRAGDAIVVRYGDASSYELMIVDGGNRDSGKALVEHVRKHFDDKVISHVVLTHADADHASGLRVVLAELPVTNLWMHVPWDLAAASRPYFANKNWTIDGLRVAIREEYDVLVELVQLAAGRKVALRLPVAGASVGPFQVLAPHQDVYTVLMPQFDRTPDPDQKAIEATGWWIGKQGIIARILEKVAAKAQTWVTETWDGAAESGRRGGRYGQRCKEETPMRFTRITVDPGRWAGSPACDGCASQSRRPSRWWRRHGRGRDPCRLSRSARISSSSLRPAVHDGKVRDVVGLASIRRRTRWCSRSMRKARSKHSIAPSPAFR